MKKDQVYASKDVVLFPDELDLVDLLGEKFSVDNWFEYMSERLDKDNRTMSQSLHRLRDESILTR